LQLFCLGLFSPATYFFERGNLNVTLSKKYCDITKLSDLVLPNSYIQNIKTPVLIIHGNQDTTIPFSNSQSMMDLLRTEKKELFVVEGADHSMKEVKYSDLAFNKMAEFFKEVYSRK